MRLAYVHLRGRAPDWGLGPGYPGGETGAEEPPGGKGFGSRLSLEKQAHRSLVAGGRSPAGGVHLKNLQCEVQIRGGGSAAPPNGEGEEGFGWIGSLR